MNSLFEEIDGCGAEFSDDEVYRYTLTRQWSDGPCVAFLMFNPSTATATTEDPTIRKCIGFARRWGYGKLVVLNLYAIRSTDPKAVKRMELSAVGPLNDFWIVKTINNVREIIYAWGCAQHAPDIENRMLEVTKYIRTVTGDQFPINCLGYRQDGHPRHPLMLKYDTPRERFIWGRHEA